MKLGNYYATGVGVGYTICISEKVNSFCRWKFRDRIGFRRWSWSEIYPGQRNALYGSWGWIFGGGCVESVHYESFGLSCAGTHYGEEDSFLILRKGETFGFLFRRNLERGWSRAFCDNLGFKFSI